MKNILSPIFSISMALILLLIPESRVYIAWYIIILNIIAMILAAILGFLYDDK